MAPMAAPGAPLRPRALDGAAHGPACAKQRGACPRPPGAVHVRRSERLPLPHDATQRSSRGGAHQRRHTASCAPSCPRGPGFVEAAGAPATTRSSQRPHMTDSGGGGCLAATRSTAI